MPKDIYNLFIRAFVDGDDNPTLRPSAEEWHKVLELLENELVTCNNDNHRVYYNKSKECPWGEVNDSISVSGTKPSDESMVSKHSAHEWDSINIPRENWDHSNDAPIPIINERMSEKSKTEVSTLSKNGKIFLAFVLSVLIIAILLVATIVRGCSKLDSNNHFQSMIGSGMYEEAKEYYSENKVSISEYDAVTASLNSL